MQIICVSRGSQSRGKEFAQLLAQKLDYALLSREDLTEAAIKEGIQVGKLETSMMKPRQFTERLARERDHYLAFSTVYLCDKAIAGPLVYHGRTGHLLLRGVGNLLRIRVLADEEYRIQAAMRSLGVERDKARRYLTEVEEDRRNWVRFMYGVSWEDALQYDVTVNVEQMNVANAASALVGMAQLPDFQMTPASRRALDELQLCARARLLLARDEQTYRASFSVKVHQGSLTVTYLPKDMEVADQVARVLAPLEGVRDIRCTMATTNILWVQEAFDPGSETFGEVVEIAKKWNAAVELVRFAPGSGAEVPAASAAPAEPGRHAADAGIEDDVEEEPPEQGGLKLTLDELAKVGRSGGGRSVYGERSQLLASCCNAVPYSLVVVGNLFLGKGRSARLRMTRELQDSIASRMKLPVVTADELRAHYLFGRRDVFRLVGFLALVVVVYTLVLTNQEHVLSFLSSGWPGTGALAKAVVAAAVFLFVPIIAFSYGVVARSLMKLIKME
jgi:cytidylate kinase